MKRRMSATRYNECRHKPHYFEMFLREATGEKPRPPKSAGLGDTLAKLFRWFGIRPCPPCQRRQRKLNRWFPYRSDN